MKNFYLALAFSASAFSAVLAWLVSTRPVVVKKVVDPTCSVLQDKKEESGQKNCESKGGVAILVDNGWRLKDCIFPPTK